MYKDTYIPVFHTNFYLSFVFFVFFLGGGCYTGYISYDWNEAEPNVTRLTSG